jgi:hypothetical protein
MSGILVAAVAVQCTPLSPTVLAWAPTVVHVDPITEPESFFTMVRMDAAWQDHDVLS